ncbi:uncharacterized protein LOC131030229 [Cryptomeria japonica]|uniref:uncharacterized protein LOC131030229 n=1 Tax=Cryptomeria japonica TaxID=3369 RepID=UPI0025AB7E7B|nr:uncharacterized protein LOC131030229 [Cryptomeria japonica]
MHVMGQLTDIMLRKVLVPKCSDLGSPVVNIVINGNQIRNVLVDLGASINVMLGITSLRPTPIVLQLADSSIVRPDGMIEDVVVTLDSWEYPANFMILSSKATLGGYPMILGRPWIAMNDAYIRYEPIVEKENIEEPSSPIVSVENESPTVEGVVTVTKREMTKTSIEKPFTSFHK